MTIRVAGNPVIKVEGTPFNLSQNFHFFLKILSGTLSVSNSFAQVQDRHFVGPDSSQNCSQKLSADDTGRQRVQP